MPTLPIPLAERLDRMTDIGRWALEQSCRDRPSGLNSSQRNDFTTAINVLGEQLRSLDFPPTAASVLALTGTDPSLVTLEVT